MDNIDYDEAQKIINKIKEDESNQECIIKEFAICRLAENEYLREQWKIRLNIK